DWGFDAGFIAAQWELNEVIALQPHVHLLSLSWDLITYRKILKQKAVDEWEELPPLDPQTGFWVLYRNQRNHMAWVAITEREYTLLKVLTTPQTVDQLCAHIETYPQKVQQEVAEHLQEWFEKWGKNRWLGTPPQDL
ncbi:MAG: hypothetical protein KDK65_05420, partial [Chlamydiia bacterium]|nr:hypothetical protein [Chlamydiia bacterium]